MTFEQAFQAVIGHEGGYVNDPRDAGGETKYGISKRAYPDEDIAGMTLDRARGIYKRDYWDRCQCDQLPAVLRMHVFDAAVNSGTTQAAKWLQLSVGTSADGVIGARTISAARWTDALQSVSRYNGLRLLFLTTCKSWPAHGRGWVRRVAQNLIKIAP